MRNDGSLPLFNGVTTLSMLPIGLALHPPAAPLELPHVDATLTDVPAAGASQAALRAGPPDGASGSRATSYLPLTRPNVDWAFSAAVPDPPAVRLRERPAGTTKILDKFPPSIAAVAPLVVDRFGPYGQGSG